MANTHDILQKLVDRVQCKPGWSFRLRINQDTSGLELVIRVFSYDAAYPGELTRFIVDHSHPVPMANYNTQTWLRWIFEQCRRVENHELGEWFRFNDDRPFAPLHGPGEDPYIVREFRPISDALTTQDGSMRQPYKESDRP